MLLSFAGTGKQDVFRFGRIRGGRVDIVLILLVGIAVMVTLGAHQTERRPGGRRGGFVGVRRRAFMESSARGGGGSGGHHRILLLLLSIIGVFIGCETRVSLKG